MDVTTLEQSAGLLIDSTELPDRTVELYYAVLREVRVLLNEYTEPPEVFAASAVRGMVALRLYHVCRVEKTLAALEDSLLQEKRRLKYLTKPAWQRLWRRDVDQETAAPGRCATCNGDIEQVRPAAPRTIMIRTTT